jgi:hypothetical protein
MNAKKPSHRFIPFNTNHYVVVKLTEFGKGVHKQNFIDFWKAEKRAPPYEYEPPKEDPDGWSRWQLNELMYEFGRHCYNGGQLCFETDIELLIRS